MISPRQPPVAGACSPDGWCPERPEQGNGLHAVWAAAPDDAWAAGEHGTVLHFDGRGWSRVASGTRGVLRAVGGSGGTVWIGGADGVLRWDGAGFVKEALPAGAAGTVCCIATHRDDLWVGIEAGRLLHSRAGAPLVKVDLGSDVLGQPTALAVSPDGAAVLALDRSSARSGAPPLLIRVRFDGSAMRAESIPPPPEARQTLGGLAFTSTGDLVVIEGGWPRAWVGRDATWTGLRLPSTGVVGRTTVAPDGGVWIAASALLQRQGDALVARASSAPGARLRDVAAAGTTVFAVGERGTMITWDGARAVLRGGEAVEPAHPARDVVTGGVSLVTESGAIERRDGGSFVRAAPALPAASHLAVTDAASVGGVTWAIATATNRDDGFSPAHTEVLRASGGALQSVHDARGVQLTALSAASPDAVWVVGVTDPGDGSRPAPDRAIVLRSAGGALAPVVLGRTLDAPVDVVAESATEAWIVTSTAVVRASASGRTTPVTLPPVGVSRLVAAWSPGPGELWVVGERGVLRIRGAAAEVIDLPSSYSSQHPLRAIAGKSTSDVLVVGHGGTVLAWNGAAWSMQDPGTSGDLVSIAYDAAGTAFVVDREGVVIRRPRR